jgi:acyl-coenzyme A thioesterase PaaI-like protein
MTSLESLVHKASHSNFYRWLLNRSLNFVVPFNAPHGLKILSVHPGKIKTGLPHKRKNLNHLGGIHACALATLCEFTVGFALMSKLSTKEYRIIMKSMRVDYHYQAKMNVTAQFEITDELLEHQILKALLNHDQVTHEFEIAVHDRAGNHICTGFILWQLKKWEKVKTNL